MSAIALDCPRASKHLLSKSEMAARRHLPSCVTRSKSRYFSSCATIRAPSNAASASVRRGSRDNNYHDQLGQFSREKLADREFFLSLLGSASTKREAKSYLSRFKPGTSKGKIPQKESQDGQAAEAAKPDVNLGSFYGASRSVYDSPVFRQEDTPAKVTDEVSERLHIALVKINTPQLLDDDMVEGIAQTLWQLKRLGMTCCVVLDPGPIENSLVWRKSVMRQADRLSKATDKFSGSNSLLLDSALIIPEMALHSPEVLSRKLLLQPLRNGQTVIVTPVAYTEKSPKAVPIPASDVLLSLAREFAGIAVTADPDEDPQVTAQRIAALQAEVSVDRLIVLDPLGGIPAFSGPHNSHVFINMEQEYEDIEDELLKQIPLPAAGGPSLSLGRDSNPSVAENNPFTKFVNSEVVPLEKVSENLSTLSGGESSSVRRHLENLRLSQKVLALLPPSSSGIITSPAEVANSAKAPESASQPSAVGTRRLRNPLIHNLLTDKPPQSSSLPQARRNINPGKQLQYPLTHSTFVKRGMPLTMLPQPRIKAWTADNGGEPRLKLDDPRIDLGRLVYLIEDSFNRKLDVQDYLDRVNDRIAGLIIAGEYEGGAILTWETPPGVVDDGSQESLARMVPYLDKFAVLKRSQGAGGVADMVFNAMVRSCFPNGVCWRSRRDNPVNKWYFERSKGTWKLPDSNWTMFWTTPGLPEDHQKFLDYEGVCRTIQPSWADNKSVVD
ncbi:acetylglutamate synthase [Paecilomyces variotii No. 5]|uniref:Amino-acid acetyltransferase, mitochondrial n=1 Tax=Byssochlamys spectabilis (strain No. 5 / NBRC 109023) TaxID=1356009 RepID=V5FBB2_BYSSN|nr:acetylglutamate synthase [Paecilomyces variotii No. 5]